MQQPKGEDGVVVEPAPSFVAKVVIIGPRAVSKKSRKLFVNFCTSEIIAQPRAQTRLTKAGDKEEEGVRVPLSVGPAKNDCDKAGEACIVHDVVVHPEVVADVEKDRSGTARHFLIELALQYLESKEGYELNHQYRLPLMRYKGSSVTSQRIRLRGYRADISEVDGSKREEIATPSQPITASKAPHAMPFSASSIEASSRSAPSRERQQQQLPTMAPGRLRGPPPSASAVPLNIRVVSKEDADDKAGIHGAIDRDLKSSLPQPDAAVSSYPLPQTARGDGAADRCVSAAALPGGIATAAGENVDAVRVPARQAHNLIEELPDNVVVPSQKSAGREAEVVLPVRRTTACAADQRKPVGVLKPLADHEIGLRAVRTILKTPQPPMLPAPVCIVDAVLGTLADTAGATVLSDSAATQRCAVLSRASVGDASSTGQLAAASGFHYDVTLPPSLMRSDPTGTTVDTLLLTATLPPLTDSSGSEEPPASITACLSHDGKLITISIAGFATVTYHLPLVIDCEQGAAARFSRNTRLLRITLRHVFSRKSLELYSDASKRMPLPPVAPVELGTLPEGSLPSALKAYLLAGKAVFTPPSQTKARESNSHEAGASAAGESLELPEDRLHRHDSLSMHFLSQRAATR